MQYHLQPTKVNYNIIFSVYSYPLVPIVLLLLLLLFATASETQVLFPILCYRLNSETWSA